MRINFDINFISWAGNSVRNEAQGEDSLVFEGNLEVDESSCVMDGGFLEEYVNYVSPQAQKIIDALSDHIKTRDQKLILKERLANPHLKKRDVQLIEEFMAAKSEMGKKRVFLKICQVLADLNKEEITTYDGWRSIRNNSRQKRMRAFEWALIAAMNLAYPAQDDNEDKTEELYALIMQRLVKKVGHLEEYLSSEGETSFISELGDCELIAKLDEALDAGDQKEITQAKRNLLIRLFEVGGRFSSFPLGSTRKISAYRRQQALYYALVSRGLTDQEVSLLSYQLEVPGLSSEDYQKLIMFERVAISPEKSDDQEEKNKFLEYVAEKVKECNSLPDMDIGKKMVLERAIEICAMMGRKMGIKSADFEKAIEKGGGIKSSYSGDQISMVDLEKNNFAVSPQQLPQKVIDLLKKYGYWEAVKTHAKKIVLVGDIKESSYVANSVGNTGGQALPAVGAVYIDVCEERWDPENETVIREVISAEEIVSTLVHEVGGHIAWHKKHFNDEYLLAVTVDERNAFLHQYLVLKKMVKDNPDLAKKLGSKISGNERGIRKANKVLGYPEDDFTFRSDLSPEAKEKDLDTYPLNL